MPRWPKKNPRPGVDEYGRTPLWYLAANGDREGVAAAVAGGADPKQGDDVGYTPLHVAVQNGHAEVVEYLLRLGADPNALDKHGNGPLWVIVMRPQLPLDVRLAVVRTLLRAGADPNHQNVHGKSPGEMARTMAQGLEVPIGEHERGAV